MMDESISIPLNTDFERCALLKMDQELLDSCVFHLSPSEKTKPF